MRKHLPSLLFLLAAAIWGFAFPIQKELAVLPVFTVGSIRYLLAAAFLFLILPLLDRLRGNGRHLFSRHGSVICDERGKITARRAGLDFTRKELLGGVDALLAVTPYYNKCTQRGLIAHYTAIADATSLPLILYNVPSRTGVSMSPESCTILSKHPRINGIKEASGNMGQLSHILLQSDMNVWSGNDDQIVSTMAMVALVVQDIKLSSL